MLASFLTDISDSGHIVPKRLATRLSMTLISLSKLAHVNRNAMQARPRSSSVQDRLGEIAEIIARAAEITKDDGAAIIWFKFQPIAGFAGKTAQDLVEEGRAAAVMLYLESVDNGAYA